MRDHLVEVGGTYMSRRARRRGAPSEWGNSLVREMRQQCRTPAEGRGLTWTVSTTLLCTILKVFKSLSTLSSELSAFPRVSSKNDSRMPNDDGVGSNVIRQRFPNVI